jgi:putative restriction endonuclease
VPGGVGAWCVVLPGRYRLVSLISRRRLSHIQAGISGAYDQGADAMFVSGGYVDDNDEGDRIVYTGEGGRDANTGRQVEDQSFHNRWNLGLVRSDPDPWLVRR